MRDNRGQVLIEAAFIIPLVLMLILGMADFGRAMYIKNTLINAAHAGARKASVVIPAPSPASGSVDDPNSRIAEAIKSSLYNGIKTDSVQYTLSIDPPSTPPSVAKTDDVIQITVTYPMDMITPFYKIAAIVTHSSTPSSDTDTIMLTAKASMRRE